MAANWNSKWAYVQLIASKAVSGAGIYGFGELYSITSVQGFVRASETFTNVDGLESGLCSIQGMHLFCVEIGCKEAVNAAGGHKSNLGLVPVSVTPQAPPLKQPNGWHWEAEEKCPLL